MKHIFIAALSLLLLALSGCAPLPAAAAGTLAESPAVVSPVASLAPAGVTIEPTEPAVTATPVLTCTVTTGVVDGTVNIRAGPGMTWAVTGYVIEGNLLLVQEWAGGWVRVATPQLEQGWMFCQRWCECAQ